MAQNKPLIPSWPFSHAYIENVKRKGKLQSKVNERDRFSWDAAFALYKMNCTLGFCWQCLRSTHQEAETLATSTEEVVSCAQALRGARLS